MELNWRFATIRELDIYFKWTNDPLVRQFSFDTEAVKFEDHITWFKKKLLSADCFLYYFTTNEKPVGQVRIDKSTEETIIGISVDPQYRGQSLSGKLLIMASNDYLSRHIGEELIAYIKIENVASYKSFCKAGFADLEIVLVKNCKSHKLVKR